MVCGNSSCSYILRHICTSTDALDINTLSHVIDRICGDCVVVFRMHGPAKLHNTTFPRSWLSWLSSDDCVSQQEVLWQIRSQFLYGISQLLESLIRGDAGMSIGITLCLLLSHPPTDHLLKIDMNHAYKRTRARNVFIHRM